MQGLIIDYKGVVTILEEKDLLDIVVESGLFDDFLDYWVNFKIKGESWADGAFPSGVLGLRDKS